MEATVYTQDTMQYNGRHVWFYLVNSPIGNIGVVDYEMKNMETARRLFDGNYEKAENYYKYTCKKMIDGKI